MRAFSSRPDTTVSDEPFYASYLARIGLDHPGRAEVLASQPQDWRTVAENLSAGPAPQPCKVWYQKHMGQHMTPEMMGDWLLAFDHIFLIRHPGRVITSYRKVIPEMSLAETGLTWQGLLFDLIREKRGITPPVIRAEDLRVQPESTLRALCSALDLDWDPAMLSWPAGPHPQDGVWAEYWYANTWSTTGFDTALSPEGAPPEPDVPFFQEAMKIYGRLEAAALPPQL